jgi:hypothetical protein
VTFAGLASADNRVAEPNLIYPLSNGTEPEILIRQMSAMGHSRTFRGGGGMSAKVPIVDINEPITALTSPPPGGVSPKVHLSLGDRLGEFCASQDEIRTGVEIPKSNGAASLRDNRNARRALHRKSEGSSLYFPRLRGISRLRAILSGSRICPGVNAAPCHRGVGVLLSLPGSDVLALKPENHRFTKWGWLRCASIKQDRLTAP